MKTVIITLVLFFNYQIFNFQQKRVLTENEIVKLAEDFVRDQGYTSEPAISDKSKWSPDSVWGVPTEEEMIERRNLIQMRAYGVVNKGSGTIPYDWVVVFRYNPKNVYYRRAIPDWEKETKKVGMAICIDKHGEHIRKVHQEIYLNDKAIKVIDKVNR